MLACQPAEVLPRLLGIVAVVDLQPQETGVDHLVDDSAPDHASTVECRRVREHGHPTGLADQPDGGCRMRRIMAHPVGRTGREDPFESLAARSDDSQSYQRIGDVRPTDSCTLGDELLNQWPGNGEIVRHQLHHALRARQPRAPRLLDLLKQPRVGRIMEIGQDMHADAGIGSARNLHAGDEYHSEPGRGVFRPLPARRRIVVRERNGVESRYRSGLYEHLRGLCAVRYVRVRVQVDSHSTKSTPRAVHTDSHLELMFGCPECR